jgi:hypothetical protein
MYMRLGSGTVADEGAGSLITGWTGGATPINQVVTLTTTLTRYQYSGVVPTDCKELGVYFIEIPTGTAGADHADSFWLEQVKLEVGSTATPFVPRPYSEELARNQRYLWGPDLKSGATYVGTTGYCFSAGGARLSIFAPVTMRAEPVAIINPAGGSTWKIFNAAGSAVDVDAGGLSLSATGSSSQHTLSITATGQFTLGQSTIMYSNDTTNVLLFSAEL